MSERKETIEERYEKVPTWYSEVLESARYALPVTNDLDNIRRLLDDLMAERGKMKERIEQLEELYYNPPFPDD